MNEVERDGSGPRLVLVPMLKAFIDGDKVGLTRKFVDGIREQERRWAGPLQVLMHPTNVESENLDLVTYRSNDVPFQLAVHRLDSSAAAEVIASSSVASLSLDPEQNHLGALCKRLGVPCVYVSEYTLKTRIQIARTQVRNPLRLARRVVWEIGQERQYRRAVSISDGVQCNGTPTFDAYSRLNPSPLLFFDTRTSASQLIPEADLAGRFAQRRASETLRLAFSGRLIAMKGADHLVHVATFLARSGRNFSLSICGAGALEESMRQAVRAQQLEDRVRFLGNLDFASELLPFLRREVDLFVSCHRQGDPSCTYLETMGCGVPIAGYDNEAWQGLARVSGAGWSTPLNDPTALGRKIASLSDADIEAQSVASLRFATAHTFEGEMERRMRHLEALANARRA
jgi:glycosyltransferase involved in cell wall biosynthesis